jgi:hypothetical protein
MELEHSIYQHQPDQMTIFEEVQRRADWDELASIGVVAPFFIDDPTPRAAAASFATGFLRSLSEKR